jgi:transcription-repair coupling factor (superfamily II helicase)
VRLEDMGSKFSDNQFMIHVLYNLTSDYDLQLALIKKRVGNAERPLNVEEIKDELSLRFERLNTKKVLFWSHLIRSFVQQMVVSSLLGKTELVASTLRNKFLRVFT